EQESISFAQAAVCATNTSAQPAAVASRRRNRTQRQARQHGRQGDRNQQREQQWKDQSKRGLADDHREVAVKEDEGDEWNATRQRGGKQGSANFVTTDRGRRHRIKPPAEVEAEAILDHD